jgi:hypothetical protein
MWTRGRLSRNFDVGPTGLTTPRANAWERGTLVRGGAASVELPPGPGTGYGYAMDPSNPRTWRRPVRFT